MRDYYRNQAAAFDRIADQCSIPDLVPYYRKRAEDCRERAGDKNKPHKTVEDAIVTSNAAIMQSARLLAEADRIMNRR